MESSETSKEVAIPVVLLAVGLALYAAKGLWFSGEVGAGIYLLGAAIQVVLGVPLGILACFITARIMQTSFGYLRSAILKLAAILVLAGAVSAAVPWFGWLVALGVYWGLLGWLFDLEFAEVVVLTIVQWIVNLFVIGLLARMVLVALH